MSRMENTSSAHGPGGHDTHVFCPANAALSLLSERWTLHIVRALLDGRKRFNEIARILGVSPATLRERLRALEEQDVVVRTVISAMPPNVEYALTPKGLALNGIFEQLAHWGREWMRPPLEAEIDSLPVPAPEPSASSSI